MSLPLNLAYQFSHTQEIYKSYNTYICIYIYIYDIYMCVCVGRYQFFNQGAVVMPSPRSVCDLGFQDFSKSSSSRTSGGGGTSAQAADISR